MTSKTHRELVEDNARYMAQAKGTMATKQTIKDFRVTWQADHEQYWQGHGIACTDYTHCATGCGETLREAFEDALEDLAQQDIEVYDVDEKEMLAELTAQVKTPKDLDMDTVTAECPGHTNVTTEEGEEEDIDCSVCSGDWHFYVNIDVKVSD